MEPVYSVVRSLLKPVVAHGLEWHVEGIHRIPRHGPAIVASNHSGYLDPLGVGYLTALQGRHCRFLTKRELFEKRFLGWALERMGQIPVDRGAADAVAALDAGADALADGRVVAVVPEGTISLDLDPMPGKTGAARLARLSGVPVTPLGMWGSHRVLFKGRPPSWQRGVAQVACLGAPVAVGEDDDVYEATDRIMEAVCAQVRKARALYPQTPRPGEDDWWVRPPETAVLRPCRKPRDGEQPGAGREVVS